MEKLTVEIEFTKEEMDELNKLIEVECLDQKKWIKRVIVETVRRRLELKQRSKAGAAANRHKEG